MQNSNGKHPILANGEYYIEALNKKNFSGPRDYPYEYDEAKTRLAGNIESIQNTISKNRDEIFIKEKVLCIRLEPKFEAKSYEPSALLAGSKMKMIGGRKYKPNEETEEKAKLYFVKTTDEELEDLKNKLVLGNKDNVKTWRNQICTIRSIDLLEDEEKVMGFEETWNQGTVEIVLHPLGDDTKEMISKFFEISGLGKEEAAVRVYDDGLTFVCTKMNKQTIDKVKKYNPLRSIKPMQDEWDEPFRMGAMTGDAPQLPDKILKSQIKVGVFDGGVKENIPLLENYVNNYDLVSTSPTKGSQEHGSGVCGAVLYGELSGMSSKDIVNNPTVNVESFRVLPAVKSGDVLNDFEMYSTIDIIEEIVTIRRDIKIFNLSFGPRGAIIDDDLNRFTYALDKLTYDVPEGEMNPLFCLAVGNDGKMTSPADRIQSPSDMVNGLAVGAYTINAYDEKIRAEYSCVGPGREGAKVKPDVLEYGGSPSRPFVIVLPDENQLGVGAGTSLASPVVAGKIGRLMANSNNIVPHLGRTLLIHFAESDGLAGDIEYGFGCVPKDVTDVLNCEDNRVTILYSGEIMSSTSVKLPIFLPEINKMNGNARIQWTISTVVNPNVNDPDAYTNNCIEDTFYPNDFVYNFRKGSKSKKLNLLIPEQLQMAEELANQGYIKSELPVSGSAQKSHREAELRNSDFKWDTVIRKQKSMRVTSLMNPFLSLHAIGRDEYVHEKICYNVVITIEVPKYQGSLYDNILQRYNNLMPIKIQNVNRVMTPVEKH